MDEKEILETVKSIVGPEAGVTRVEWEGPEIGIYTKNPLYFLENENAVAQIANTLKKRVNIRSDSSILTPPEHAKEVIIALVPEAAGITDIEFMPDFGTVIIEARKPGLVIGKGGSTLKQIVGQTGWLPTVVRTPSMESNILKGIVHLYVKHAKDRKKFLKDVSVRINRGKKTERLWVRIHALGAAREVGRSAFLLETPNSKILLDAGVNVASKEDMFPLLDAAHIPLNEIDAIIVTHAHLDHCGLVPYLYKLGYKGPVYCTPPTRDLSALLQFDFIDVLVKDGQEPPYSERDVKTAALHCITRNYGEVTDIAPDIKITFHNAGHVLGSSIVHIHVGQGFHNIVYTGDLKFGYSRLLNPADTRYPRVETLIIESTYGGRADMHPSRRETEQRLEQIIKETEKRGGKVLIPVFAVGRAQELMLTLEDMYRRNGFDLPIYIDGMVKEASAIHTAYPEYLRKDVQRRILHNDSPFEKDYFVVVDPKKRDEVLDDGPAIILAPSGALTGGPAVEYFRRLAEDERNALVLVGYQFEGSLGRKLQKGIREIPVVGENGKLRALQVKMRVETLHGFSGHSDRRQLEAFISKLTQRPKRLIVVHGEEEKAVQFSKDMGRKHRIESLAPRLLDVIRVA